MKLLRYGPRGQEKPGLLDAGGVIRDLSGEIAHLDPEAISPAGLGRLAGLDPAGLPEVSGAPRLGLPDCRHGQGALRRPQLYRPRQ